MSQPLDKVAAHMRGLGASTYMLKKSEIPHIAKQLHRNEVIEAFVYGVCSTGFGFMIATDKRLIFIDKIFFDLKMDDIAYPLVTAVEHNIGVVFSRVQVYTRAKNFKFTRVRHELGRNFSRYVEERMIQAQDVQPARR